MKFYLYIIFFTIFISCQNEARNENKQLLEKTNKTKIFEEINGIWVLSNYLDVVKGDKTTIISDFNSDTHLAKLNYLFLEFKDTKVRIISPFNNSREFTDPIFLNDSIFYLNKLIPFQFTVKDKNRINIKYTPSNLNKAPSNINHEKCCHYRRVSNKELKLMEEGDVKFNRKNLYQNIESLLNENLFRGKYRNKDTNETIEFTNNGEIKGFNDFKKYKINSYLADMHLHKTDETLKRNADCIYLYRETNSSKKMKLSYSWKFINDTLILQEFKDISKKDNEPVYIPKEKEIILIKE